MKGVFIRFSDELIVPYTAGGVPPGLADVGKEAGPFVEEQESAVSIELRTTPVTAVCAATKYLTSSVIQHPGSMHL